MSQPPPSFRTVSYPKNFDPTDAGRLAATFQEDAASLRYYADERLTE